MNPVQAYAGQQLLVGDLHNHCGISYAHGSLADALHNARLQLDFASVTGHAAWPDAQDQPMPQDVIDYHDRGFAKLRGNWSAYQEAMEDANKPGRFVTFHGYEIHSFRHGDRTIVSPEPLQLPPEELGIEEFERMLATTDARRDRVLLLPHHIGYPTGLRGVNWDSVSESSTPVIEVLSMHGLAEPGSARFPYLHTMGPLDPGNTMSAGLQRGIHFGVVASTDHHSAHPGSFGHGRTAVWAESCTREAIWDAICSRRTYALSGDRIELTFTVDGQPMGARFPRTGAPRIQARVRAGGAVDRLEVVRDGAVVTQLTAHDRVTPAPADGPVRGLLVVELGWGEKGSVKHWDLGMTVIDGTLEAVEPRLRGHDVVDPLDPGEAECRFSDWQRSGDTVRLQTRTRGNPTTTTVQTQAMALDVSGSSATKLRLEFDGRTEDVPLAELQEADRLLHTHGFVSPAIRIHRFLPEVERVWELDWTDKDASADRPHWYQLRVLQVNGHGAWSSPVRVEPAGNDHQPTDETNNEEGGGGTGTD